MYEGYCRNPANGSPQQTAEQPQTYFRQPGGQYPQTQPAAEALTFDKDDESDRELLREDPYAEYIDFPKECRMKDETQAELICY